MKLSLKAVALGALLASATVAAPIEVEKRDAASNRIAACFVGLIFTGSWPSSCKAAVSVSLGLIKAIDINQMSMDFTPADPWKPTTSSNNIVATMLSIPGITLPITSIQQHIILTDNGVQLGSIGTPWAAASVKGATMTTSFATSTLNVFPTAQTAFIHFVGTLSGTPSKTITLQGSVDAKLSLGIFGSITIPGIGFKVDTVLQGLDGLKVVDYKYLIDQDFDFMNNLLSMSTIVNLKNPSKLNLKLGDVSFSTAAAGGYVGVSTIKNLDLAPGDNFVISKTTLDMSLTSTQDFLNSLSNADGPLDLTGFSGTSSDIVLNAALSAMKSLLVIPQNFAGSVVSQAPYQNWAIKVLPTTKTDKLVDITATFKSPYYGYSFQMTSDEPDGQDNYAHITGVAPALESFRLFEFRQGLTFSVSGTGSATVTFKASIANLVGTDRSRIETLISYAAANGGVPVNLWWIISGIVNNDGTDRQALDWGTSGTGIGNFKVATGADFASLIDSVPA
ncbi:hypothetical protein BG004_002403 [Podila humilis]|nr:hypothetical protein BG004_002403 [Podila humilis]